jgi:hypothetical protein
MGYRTEFTWECDTLNCGKKDSLGSTLPFGTTVLDVMIENGWTVINEHNNHKCYCPNCSKAIQSMMQESNLVEEIKKVLLKEDIIVMEGIIKNSGITIFAQSNIFQLKSKEDRQSLVWGIIKRELPRDDYSNIKIIAFTPDEEITTNE